MASASTPARAAPRLAVAEPDEHGPARLDADLGQLIDELLGPGRRADLGGDRLVGDRVGITGVPEQPPLGVPDEVAVVAEHPGLAHVHAGRPRRHVLRAILAAGQHVHALARDVASVVGVDDLPVRVIGQGPRLPVDRVGMEAGGHVGRESEAALVLARGRRVEVGEHGEGVVPVRLLEVDLGRIRLALR